MREIAGSRCQPAEVESGLVGHDEVTEASVMDVLHEVKGEAVVCFIAEAT